MDAQKRANELASRIRDMQGNIQGRSSRDIRRVEPELRNDIVKSRAIIKEFAEHVTELERDMERALHKEN